MLFLKRYQISNESFHEEIDSMVIAAFSSIDHKHVVNNLKLIFDDVTFYVTLFLYSWIRKKMLLVIL